MSDTYPGLAQVADSGAQAAIRLVWDRIGAVSLSTMAPTTGTLNPDTKPTGLGPKDSGRIFLSTDYNRRYRWTGTSWEDDPSAPTRYQITYFLAGKTPEPATGWVACDGTTVNASTALAGTEAFTTPIIPALNGQTAWIRL